MLGVTLKGGKFTIDGVDYLQVLAADESFNQMQGRMFQNEHNELGVVLTAQRDSGQPLLTAVWPQQLKTGSTTTLTLHGANLSGSVVLPAGVELLAVERDSASEASFDGSGAFARAPASDDGSCSDGDTGSTGGGYVQDVSPFDRILLSAWEDRFAAGLFRYDVTAVKTKVVPGGCGFVAQFNEGRATKKRPARYPMTSLPPSAPTDRPPMRKPAANTPVRA